MNGLQKEIENRHLPELMRLENGDAVTNCADWKLRWKKLKSYCQIPYMMKEIFHFSFAQVHIFWDVMTGMR